MPANNVVIALDGAEIEGVLPCEEPWQVGLDAVQVGDIGQEVAFVRETRHTELSLKRQLAQKVALPANKENVLRNAFE